MNVYDEYPYEIYFINELEELVCQKIGRTSEKGN